MAKLKLIVELDYDAESVHGDDEEAKRWFFDGVLSADPADDEECLILHSNSVGDELGRVRVLSVVIAEPEAKSARPGPRRS